jgi:hypothetical protein
MISDWVSFLTYPNLFEIKDCVVVAKVKMPVLSVEKPKDRDSCTCMSKELYVPSYGLHLITVPGFFHWVPR